ncbi:MAG: glycosyltransferase family 4 protein [Dehalococcoidales bacterium]|nr:glycosyltransferase family 4 protein [Dehalococcoidales bacterium]
MNICLTVNYSPWSRYYGGGQIVVHNLARHLSETGHKIFVVYAAYPVIKPGDDVNYQILWARNFGRYIPEGRVLNIFSVFRRVQKLLSQTHIDIVHGNGDEAALLHLAAKKHGCRFVMTAHRLYPRLSLTGSLKRTRGRLYREIPMFLQRHAYEKAEKVFTVSHYARENLSANLGISAQKIEVIYNAVNDYFFTIARHGEQDKINLTFWGRLAPGKGIDTLLRALAIAGKKSQKEMCLSIIGEGLNKHKVEFWRLTKILGLSDRVSFIPRLSHNEMSKILAKTHLCLFPTQSESFGLTVAEALAAGIPTISTTATSIPEIITHGETGILVTPNDPEVLAEQILYALDNYPEMERIAQAGKHRVASEFTWDKVAAKYSLAYERLLRN